MVSLGNPWSIKDNSKARSQSLSVQRFPFLNHSVIIATCTCLWSLVQPVMGEQLKTGTAAFKDVEIFIS